MQIITRRTVIKQLNLDGEVLDRLEELEIVVPIHRPGRERGYGAEDVDNLRVYQVLVHELGVNPAGAEIILRMRNQLLGIRQRMGLLLTEMKAQGMLDEFRELLESLERDVW
jgi:MerR family transcriptional regulator/heat shock protein HspR